MTPQDPTTAGSGTTTTAATSATPSSADSSKAAVIIGGGFGGYYAAHELARHHVPVTLIEQNGCQTFQPLLYQSATGLIDPADLKFDYSQMKGVNTVAERVTAVDLASRMVQLAEGGTIKADHLVLATGSTVNFFGVPGAEEHALPLYTGPDAHAIKRRLQELVEGGSALRVVVVGAGATGVEITGAISDVVNDLLPRTYPQFQSTNADLHLVDHGSAPLASMAVEGQKFAATTLESVGVTLHMNRAVTAVAADSVALDDGTTLPADLVIWAGGLTANNPQLTPDPQRTRGNRIVVGPDLRIPGYDNVYAIGDNSADADKSLPQLGSVAKQQGHHVGSNIHRQISGREPKPFHYRDMGDMAMVRHDAAVVEMGQRHHPVTGTIAFGMWLGLHAYLLPGDRHRLDALHTWAHELASGKSHYFAD